MICAPVCAELLAHPKAAASFVDEFLSRTHVVTDFLLDQAVWRKAGSAFAEYAQRGRRSKDGAPRRLLVDFLVGAHALLKADRLLTLEATLYRHAFPDLNTIP